MAARYLRARGHEDGYFGTKDLQAALADYGQLGDQADFFGSDGLMGCARVLFEMGEAANEEEIIGLCLRAISVDKNVKAMMLLGLVHERVLADYVTAGAWYRRAYLSGLPWGMRYYARMHWERGHYVRGGVGHLIATLTSPLMVAFGGARSPLK